MKNRIKYKPHFYLFKMFLPLPSHVVRAFFNLEGVWLDHSPTLNQERKIIIETIDLILNQDILEKYNKYYFKQHPKAKKAPIERPMHPSINTWMILPRIQMNQLKQKWKDFIIFWIRDLDLQDKHLESFEMIFTTYMPTKRRVDCDNTVPKFILDGFSESGFIIDDDGKHLHSLTLKTGYDKDNPRTEIKIIVK